MINRFTTTNMVLINDEKQIIKHKTIYDIMNDFIFLLFKYYKLRHEKMINKAKEKILKISSGARFINVKLIK